MSVPRPPRLALVALALSALACRESATPTRVSPGAFRETKIVVMAPSAAETLVVLGLADQVVGVGDFVTGLPALAGRPRVGGYDAPDVERLLALGTTLYVTARAEAGAAARARLGALGVDVLALDTSTYAGTLAGIETLGGRVGRLAEARALSAAIRQRVETVRERAQGAPRRRVLCVVGRDPLYAAGPGSHLDELIRVAGGENVLGDGGAPYVLASLESVLARRPQVIVDLADNSPGALRGARVGPWSRWPLVPAVRERRVYLVDPTRLAIPGPRLGEMAELLARLVQPERFGVASEEEMCSAEASPAPGGGS
ncbi:MAG: ABC transporter substrate-binding protein [Holophagales bacterium]|nr:MAG: ABC transporter substrate-binding protein [Holophagales bacterium]